MTCRQMATRRVRRRRLRTKRRSRKQRGGNNPTIGRNELSHLDVLLRRIENYQPIGNAVDDKNRYEMMKRIILFVLNSKELLNDPGVREVFIEKISDIRRDFPNLITRDPDEMDRKLNKLEMIINEMNLA